MRLRCLAPVATVLAALICGACSSDAAEAPVTAATFVTVPNTTAPATATSTTSAPATNPTGTAAIGTAATATVATNAATSVGPTTSDASSTTVTTATAATTTLPAAETSTTAPATADFTPVAGPSVGDRTTAIDPAWLGPDGTTLTTVVDGTYWATLAGEGDTPQRFVRFTLSQAFFGAACTARFGDDSCDNDFATLEVPTGTFPLYLGTARLTVADAATQQSFQVTNDELFALVGGTPPSAAAPAGFTYVPFAFLLTVQGGQIVSAEQVWTP